MRFSDRTDAGRKLAEQLAAYANHSNVVVLALPRGGVPVAYEVAQALRAPLDVFVVRKLGVPGHEELAMGAIAPGGVRVLNEDLVAALRISPRTVDAVADREQQELSRRELYYRGARPPVAVRDCTAIVIDDGLATGATMRAAVAALRQQRARRILVAVPVAAPEVCQEFRAIADEVVCAQTPANFAAVGAWYEDFSQTTDDEVCRYLDRARNRARQPLFLGPAARPV